MINNVGIGYNRNYALNNTQNYNEKNAQPKLYTGVQADTFELSFNENSVKATTPFTEKELPQIQKELESFITNVFAKETEVINPPKLMFNPYANIDEGQGTISSIINAIVLPEGLLTEDLYKLVDKTTGECVEDKEVLWQVKGSKKGLEDIIKDEGFENVEIVPVTREERIKILKGIIAHEGFHLIQMQRFVQHPDIGKEKVLYELNPYLDKERLKELITEYGDVWANVEQQLPKLDPNSELGKETMEQYQGMLEALNEKNEEKTVREIYPKMPTELEAYRRQREFEKAHGLLL